MKNYLLLLLVLLLPFGLKAQTAITLSKDTTTYDASNIERQPSFPGGNDDFQKFVKRTLRYPAEARKNNIQGEVELGFVVNTDGTLSDIRVTKSLASDLDKEALRIMKLSPKWVPAIKNQKAINCGVTVPISFRLN
jgi:TonB family protein